MSFRETSTMISDFVLSATCFLAGTGRISKLRNFSWREFGISWFGMIGFSVIGFAAFLGVLRFGYIFPRRHYSLKDWHRYFSDLGSMFGLPMLAAAFTQRTEWQNLCWLFLFVSLISILLHCVEALHLAVRDFCAAMSVLFILFSGIFMDYRGVTNRYSVAGSVSFILATLVSTQGRGIFGVKNVDWFHYLLAIGVYCWAEALML
ncbi:uncharacterized protein [Clytia hemisphaerica]|uniref:Uncharacterized protein n=1 Tax=Clytia hemisphaerica TaxID=252671 RepID=A0A7M5WUL7_9CNID|eukprot:TCONS_00064674-protein